MRIKDFESDVFHWFINKSISKIEVNLGKLIYSSKATIFFTVIGQNWSFLIGPKIGLASDWFIFKMKILARRYFTKPNVCPTQSR